MTGALSDAARRILANETGGATSPDQVAAGAASACEKLSVQLSPLIGEAGIRALFARSLVLTRARFAWLEHSEQAGSGWGHLRACIARQRDEAAIEASVALLATFMGLLGKFIGGGLTARLVHVVWPEVLSARPPKESK